VTEVHADKTRHARGARGLFLSACVLGAAVILSFWRLHADNNDAALYTVIARNLAREHTPFSLHGPALDFRASSFYEHPPLFLWAQAAVLAVAPWFDLRLLGALCGVLTVAATFALGREVLGARAGFLGCVLLIATEAFSNYQPLARLDPPLTLAFTASVAVLVLARGRPGLLFLGGLIAGAGALVKGPPALGAPVAALALAAARGDTDVLRRPRSWLAVGLGAVLPPLSFLIYDRVALGGAWWDGYVIAQVVASAAGRRSAGAGPLGLLKVNVWRLWPGLPLVGVSLARACIVAWKPLEKPDSARVRFALLGWAALVYAGFSSAGRAFWWYLMPAYPALSLLAGAGAEDLIPRALADRGVAWVRRLALAISAALWVLLPFCKVAARLERPCPFGDLPTMARGAADGGQLVAVVSPTRDYSTHVIFAEHCRCNAVLISRLQEGARTDVAAALVPSSEPYSYPWRRLATHGTWTLLERVR
jgi:4-amino-4-deoxy-L-arabinose transferase-like glycosyltransferase